MSVQSCYQSVSNFFGAAGQTFMCGMKKVSELRGDETIFKNTCRIAASAIELATELAPASMPPLGRLTRVTKAVILHDFWAFLQYPRAYFRPISSEIINEKAVKENLIARMKRERNDSGEHTKIATEVITAQLESMSVPYHNFDEFIDKLQFRLSNARTEDEEAGPNFAPFNGIDLSDLKNPETTNGWVREQKPLLERVTNAVWALVDGLTVAWCSSELWNIVDAGKYAENIGQYRGFQWVKNQKLEQCLIGFVCVGFALKFVEAARSLSDDRNLTDEERTIKTMNRNAAVVELAFYSAIFVSMTGMMKISPVTTNLLGIAARSFGIMNIINRPKHEFFG